MKNYKILVVDDSPDTRLIILKTLKKAGYQKLRSVESGEQAISAVASEKPDLILLDVRMTGIDGLEVCRHLKQYDNTREIPIIFISGAADAEERIAGLHAGAVDYVIKPFDPEELVARMKIHLEMQGLKKMLAQEKEKIHSILSSSPAGIIVFNQEFQAIYANPAAENLFNNKIPGLDKIRCGDFMLCENRKKDPRGCGYSQKCAICPIFNKIREVLSSSSDEIELDGESSLSVENRNSTLHVRFKVKAFFLEGQRSALLSIEDITDMKLAENALQESEFFFKESQRVADIGSYKFYFNADRWESSEVLDNIFGIDKTYARNAKGWLDIVHPDDMEMMDKYLREEIIGQRKLFSKEYRIIRKNDGVPRWVNGLGEVKVDANGKPLSLIGTIQDITERKQREEEAHAAKEFLDSVAGFGFTKDIDLKYVSANRAFCDLLKIPYNEVQGKTDYDIFPADLAEKYIADDKRVIETAMPLIVEEETINSNTKQRFIVQTRKFPRFDKNGIVTGIYGMGYDVTELRQAEHALREREERYRGLVTNLEAGVVVHAPDTSIIMNNSRAAELLGLSDEQMRGKLAIDPGWKFIKENGNPYSIEEYPVNQIASKKKVIKNLVLGIKRPASNDVVWVAVNAIPLLDGKGDICEIVISFTDITERKRIQDELRFNNEKLELALQASSMGVWRWEIQENKRYFDPQVCHLLGINYETFKGTKDEFFARIHPDDQEMLREVLAQTLENDAPYAPEYRAVWPDGSIHYVSASGRLIRDDKGKPLRTIGVIWDISERKKAEEALRESEKEFRSLAESMPQIVWATRPDGWNIYFNQQWVDYTGLTLEQSYGHGWNTPFHPDDKKRAWEAWQRATQNGETYSLECRLRRADGAYRWWLIRGVPSRDERGKILKWFGTCTDIDDIRKGEEEKLILEAKLRQAQKMEAVGQLAGGVAHDFNNMLSVINGYSEMLLMELDSSDSKYDRIKEISKAGLRSAELTQQLLAFARKQTIAPKVLDLNETVAGMLKMLQRLIGENIELIWKPGPNLWKVKMDPSQINQILANLFVNARDAISGSGKIVIDTAKVELDDAFCLTNPDLAPGKYVVLEVSDNGCGMDKKTLEHIFEPFFTTKKIGEGTGLGLSTVFGIVKQNNCGITVYSEPGIGTTFKIYLPRHQSEGYEEKEEAETSRIFTGIETVLLVEDELSLLRYIKSQLGRLGYTVLAADSPAEAIRIAGEYKGDIHLLMTDVIMPEMSGRDLKDKINEMRPGIKCLFMSGYTADIIADEGVLDKGIHFLEKPFTAEELSAKLREALS